MGVSQAAHAAADRQRDEDLVGGPPHDVDHGVALVGGGRDVQEHDLVGAGPVIAGRQLDGITCVAQVLEVDALDDAAGVDVETRDHADGSHAASASFTSTRPS